MQLCNLSSPRGALLPVGGLLPGALIRKATFGVFYWLEVTDFDRFLFLVSHFWFSFVGLFVVCVVSVTPNSN